MGGACAKWCGGADVDADTCGGDVAVGRARDRTDRRGGLPVRVGHGAGVAAAPGPAPRSADSADAPSSSPQRPSLAGLRWSRKPQQDKARSTLCSMMPIIASTSTTELTAITGADLGDRPGPGPAPCAGRRDPSPTTAQTPARPPSARPAVSDRRCQVPRQCAGATMRGRPRPAAPPSVAPRYYCRPVRIRGVRRLVDPRIPSVDAVAGHGRAPPRRHVGCTTGSQAVL